MGICVCRDNTYMCIIRGQLVLSTKVEYLHCKGSLYIVVKFVEMPANNVYVIFLVDVSKVFA